MTDKKQTHVERVEEPRMRLVLMVPLGDGVMAEVWADAPAMTYTMVDRLRTYLGTVGSVASHAAGGV